MEKPSLFRDRMELCGNRDLFIDRCRRLLECSELLMLMELDGHRVAVWGHGLTASDYSESGLHITGEIRTVEFDGGI